MVLMQDERILRGQCLNMAHDYATHHGSNFTEEDVLALAKKYHKKFRPWMRGDDEE